MDQQPPNTDIRLRFDRVGNAGRVRISVIIGDRAVFTDIVVLASASKRAALRDELLEKFKGLARETLDQQLEQAAADAVAAPMPRREQIGDDDEAQPTREELLAVADEHAEAALEDMPDAVRAEAAGMLADPGLIDLILRDIEAVGVVGERILACTTYIQGTSRLLDKPLAAIVQGVTSTGKSFVPLRCSNLFPPEAVLNATDITTNALYYFRTGALMHKFVVAGERHRRNDDDRAEATRALREMIETGELRKAIPICRPGAKPESVVIWQPGPIAFIESTTAANIMEEDANRCILLSTDESEEQTRRIVTAQARNAAGATTDTNPVQLRHHAIQRMLRRVTVEIPFAERIAEKLPTKRNEARRAMPQVISMIRAVCLVYQFQRAPKGFRHGDRITASVEDYVIARRLLEGPMGRALGGGLPAAVAAFGKRLTEQYGTGSFSTSQALKDDPVLNSRAKVGEYLNALEAARVAECTEPGKGNRPSVWKIVGDVPEGSALWLPTVEDIGGAQ